MTERVLRTRSGRARIAVAAAVTMTLAMAAVSCGSEGDEAGSGSAGTVSSEGGDSAPSAGGADPVNGEQLSRSQGCAGCHGANFDGGAGPGWVGLAGSERLLADGTTVVADTAYLVRAIADPSAELLADYTLRMPANNLSDAEIADIVAYIETLAER